jgi:hypothetical protein
MIFQKRLIIPYEDKKSAPIFFTKKEANKNLKDYLNNRANESKIEGLEIIEIKIIANPDKRTEICIYCGKEINKNIQPWNYIFPDQMFHIGCKKITRNKNKND